MKKMILVAVVAMLMVGCGRREESKTVEVYLEHLESVNDLTRYIDAHGDEYDEIFGDRNWTATWDYSELDNSGHYVVEEYRPEIYE